MMVRLFSKGRVWQGSDKEIRESQGVRRAVLRDWLGPQWPMPSMPSRFTLYSFLSSLVTGEAGILGSAIASPGVLA